MSNNWIILGVCHSGTTIMQKTLITQPGMSGLLDPDEVNKYRESLPDVNNLKNISNFVWKHPWCGGGWAENTARFLINLVKNCDTDIQSKQNVVFMHRPTVEIICSFLLRINKNDQLLDPFNKNKKQTIKTVQNQIAYINWYNSTREWFKLNFQGNIHCVDLLEFTTNTSEVLHDFGFNNSRILGKELGKKTRPQKDHEDLRAWQANLKPNPKIIRRDFSQHIHSSWLEYISAQIANYSPNL
tara:strand:- start:87 stop:812 length:726 start_codon:yes stop_codon:yes gene_type:complete